MFQDKHGKELHQGDIVVDSHGHVFQLKGTGASFKGHGVVRVAWSSELSLVHKAGSRSIIWGSDIQEAQKTIVWGGISPETSGADGDTIMWGT
jgi:hypothetical protein